MGRRAVICGGSVGGLFAACALGRAGWHVDVYERAAQGLTGRGAGIVTHPELVGALRAVGAETADLGVMVHERVAFDIAGGRVATMPYAQLVTSWDRVYRVLRAALPRGCHHPGRAVVGYRQEPGRAVALFEDGAEEPADLVVGADGFRSAIRAQMLPHVVPDYAGYVVWRTLARESDLPADLHRAVFAPFGIFAPDGSQVVTYPIAGADNDLRPGHLRFNFVWYVAASRAELADMLTDGEGRRHAMSIPPPLVRDEVIAAMRSRADTALPPPLARVLGVADRPFFTPIYDHHAPVMAQGRVVLAGDAATVARPHVGMGVTKAALDALALARHLGGPDIKAGTAAYSAERSAAAHRACHQARRLGALIFNPTGGGNADGRSHPALAEIMRRTAAPV